MSLPEVITVISSLTIVIGIAVTLLNRRIEDTNKRIDDLKQDVNKRFDDLRQDVNKRIDDLKQDVDRRFDRIEQDIRELRQLLYKVLEVPQKEEK